MAKLTHDEVDAYYSGNKEQRKEINRRAAHRGVDRQAASERRNRVRKAGVIVDRAPGILSAVFALVFLCLIGSRFAMVVAGTSQMEYFFENDLAISEDLYPAWGMTTAYNEEGSDPWLEGTYISISGTLEEIGNLSEGKSNIFDVFFAVAEENAKIILSAFGTEIPELIYKALGWLSDTEEWLEGGLPVVTPIMPNIGWFS